jgi:hypothetical protein
MKKLMIKFLGGHFFQFSIERIGEDLLVYFKLGALSCIVNIFGRTFRRGMGLCRVHVHCGTFYIFHWCDLCVVPKIKGVNL